MDSSSTPQKQLQEENPIPIMSIIEPIIATTYSPPPPPPPSVSLLHSPSSLRRSRTRLADRLEAAAAEESPEPAPGVRRRCKAGRGAQAGGAAAGASPRNARRQRRRTEAEVREEKDVVLVVEEVGKPRKRRQTVRTKKEKSNLVVPPTISSPKAEEDQQDGGDLERVGQAVSDLIMWKDVAKSTLWFGFGSLCLLSSCFSQGLNFSIFSAVSQLAIVFLGVSFVSNTICQRNQVEKKREFKLKEDDILRLAKLILPALNLAISKTRQLFSGEPSMTLKIAPFLLLGAEYGHFITIWRLCAIGFFLSFTAPKLYSCYTTQINRRAECLTLRLLDTWYACTHKKKLVTSALVAFWNLSSVKTRIYTAFILLVLFRYVKQHVVQQLEEGEAQTQVAEKERRQVSVVAGPEEKEPQQTSMVAGIEEKEPQQALAVREQEKGCDEIR